MIMRDKRVTKEGNFQREYEMCEFQLTQLKGEKHGLIIMLCFETQKRRKKKKALNGLNYVS